MWHNQGRPLELQDSILNRKTVGVLEFKCFGFIYRSSWRDDNIKAFTGKSLSVVDSVCSPSPWLGWPVGRRPAVPPAPSSASPPSGPQLPGCSAVAGSPYPGLRAASAACRNTVLHVETPRVHSCVSVLIRILSVSRECRLRQSRLRRPIHLSNRLFVPSRSR